MKKTRFYQEPRSKINEISNSNINKSEILAMLYNIV